MTPPPPSEMARHLVRDFSRKELFELIVEIDEQVGHWPFSSDLARHFEKLREEHHATIKLDRQGGDGTNIGGRTL